MPRPTPKYLRAYFWLIVIIFPFNGHSNSTITRQDSTGDYVKSRLAQAAKSSSEKITDALTITNELLQEEQIINNDSIYNYVKYRHSLYLLLSDKNEESRKIVNEILPYYKNNDLKKYTTLNIRLGSLEIRLGEYAKAKEHLESAIPYCDQLGLSLNKGLAKVYLADIHLIKSEFSAAFQQVDQAQYIFKSLDRPEWVASALTDLAYICIRATDYKAASEYFKQIELLKPKIKNQSFLVRPNLFEGILNFKLGNYSKAKSQLKTGIDQINSIGTFPDLPIIFQYLAKISLLEKDMVNAKDYIKSAIEYAERADNKNFLHNAHLTNIELNKFINPNHDYLAEATSIYNWATANGDLELTKKSSLLISKRHENQKQYINALKFRDIYESALVKSINNDKLNQISVLKEKNKFEQEAKEIALSEENLQLKVISNDKIKSILITSISLLSVLLTSLLYFVIKNRKKNNLLALNNEELIRADRKLANKNNELESYIESNIQLEQFAHVASHDLRSPILTINSFAQLLKQKAASKLNENELKYLSFIEANGKQMLDLVTDLLDYSKLNSQVLNIADVEINNLLQEVTNSIKPQAEEKSIQIETKCNFQSIKADEIKLKRVFQNLISNSIKFSDQSKDSYIKINCKENKTNYKFNVEDNGIGIKDHSIDLFQPYVQLNLKSKYKGTGLGLSVCKKIIEQHGGNIDYSGEAGKGTTFSFSIAKHIDQDA